MKTMIDKAAVSELALYVENTRQVYDRATMPTVENLRKKNAKGQYDKEKAIKAWEYVAEYAAKLYHKEFCGCGKWYDVFNAATRREVARYLEDVYYQEYIK